VKIRPISQYVIIKLDPADQMVQGSTILTAAAMSASYDIPKRTGTVMASGRGLVTASGAIIPPQVHAGDRVYVLELRNQQGTVIENKVEYDGEQCIVLSDESHIIGVIED